MGNKEFAEELSDLMRRACKEGVIAGHMTFASIVGTLELCKMDVHNLAQVVAAEQAEKKQPLILTPRPA